MALSLTCIRWFYRLCLRPHPLLISRLHVPTASPRVFTFSHSRSSTCSLTSYIVASENEDAQVGITVQEELDAYPFVQRYMQDCYVHLHSPFQWPFSAEWQDDQPFIEFQSPEQGSPAWTEPAITVSKVTQNISAIMEVFPTYKKADMSEYSDPDQGEAVQKPFFGRVASPQAVYGKAAIKLQKEEYMNVEVARDGGTVIVARELARCHPDMGLKLSYHYQLTSSTDAPRPFIPSTRIITDHVSGFDWQNDKMGLPLHEKFENFPVLHVSDVHLLLPGPANSRDKAPAKVAYYDDIENGGYVPRTYTDCWYLTSRLEAGMFLWPPLFPLADRAKEKMLKRKFPTTSASRWRNLRGLVDEARRLNCFTSFIKPPLWPFALVVFDDFDVQLPNPLPPVDDGISDQV
ncbi:hypothetical protein CC86DRAFT_425516 [Ophiobolus disseminans]|uniref:Uncharacterized protein n=1 Tax=Ophiobolus disseminans TaxID=1469910 RepID=A0A6A6ZNK2_9PLEO|nr:hypothetical protein CC86DRAFT_425516 [Ophiobolus disseminans]